MVLAWGREFRLIDWVNKGVKTVKKNFQTTYITLIVILIEI